MMRVAVLDDWQKVAADSADWSALQARAEVVFFQDAFADEEDRARKLADFDILMSLRERSPFPASLVRRLPRLKMFAMTGNRAATIDHDLMSERGVVVSVAPTSGTGSATAELALGLMLAAVRRIAAGDAMIRAGGFQAGVGVGYELNGRTAGVIGLGKLGARFARFCTALDMKVIAWSQNLTDERARECGVERVSKDELLARADVISIHMVLSARSRGIVGAADMAKMKSGAVLINTSRGPLIDEPALIAALKGGKLIAALDVYDHEPLPVDHPLRSMPNTVLSPHVGYVTAETYRQFYRQGIENVLAFLDGKPIRVLEPAKG